MHTYMYRFSYQDWLYLRNKLHTHMYVYIYAYIYIYLHLFVHIYTIYHVSKFMLAFEATKLSLAVSPCFWARNVVCSVWILKVLKNTFQNASNIFKHLQCLTSKISSWAVFLAICRESVAWDVVLSFEARRSSLRRRTAAWMYSWPMAAMRRGKRKEGVYRCRFLIVFI